MFRKRRVGGWLGLLLALALAAGWSAGPGAQAVRWVPLTLEQLAAGAGLVVHARVTAVEVARDAEDRVFTRIELEVREVWKGAVSGANCEIVAGGGVLGTRSEETDAQARYQAGEELVAYLVRNPAGEWVTLGLGQGRFLVRRGAVGEPTVHNPFWGDDGLGGAGGGAVRLPMRRPLTLGELKRRTQEAAP